MEASRVKHATLCFCCWIVSAAMNVGSGYVMATAGKTHGFWGAPGNMVLALMNLCLAASYIPKMQKSANGSDGKPENAPEATKK